ncbi:MAG: polyprenyl synthetase family protein [Ignavibacteria bacterium]|nr:polyprenyl synthetase family protein [Ignavibacteria bacterium]
MKSNFDKYRKQIDDRLFGFLKEQTERSRYSKSGDKYPFSLYDPLNYIMNGGGKRIRPLLVLLSCEAFGGDTQNAIDAAVSVEILHNFTLVHDDIMDNAGTRRGKETIHKKWDVNAAILVGDELIGLSYRSLLRSKTDNITGVVRAFTDGVIEVCEGQAMDKEFETSTDVTLDDYLIMIRKKTAELLRTSSVMGAIIGNADEHGIKSISSYSENIGLAFQIQDDLLDVIADEGEFGKKIGGDIIERKKTFLYLKALELLNGNAKDEFLYMYNTDSAESDKIKKIISIYNDICVINSARKEIEKYTILANRSIDCINSVSAKNNLEQFSNMLLNRNY